MILTDLFFVCLWNLVTTMPFFKEMECPGLQEGCHDTCCTSFFSMPLKEQKNQACDCLLNLWSGPNETCSSSLRAKRRPNRMGPVLHQHSFIQGVRGFRPQAWELLQQPIPWSLIYSLFRFCYVLKNSILSQNQLLLLLLHYGTDITLSFLEAHVSNENQSEADCTYRPAEISVQSS